MHLVIVFYICIISDDREERLASVAVSGDQILVDSQITSKNTSESHNRDSLDKNSSESDQAKYEKKKKKKHKRHSDQTNNVNTLDRCKDVKR